jgi:xanthine dehydrogenase FAD-binding subunit
MIPDIEYIRPGKIKEVLSLLVKNQGNTCIIAGGTDLIPGFQQGTARFQHIKKLIDINQIGKLKIIEKDDQNIIIGAGVSFSELMRNPLIKDNFPLLAKAASTVGSVQIRNRATIGGNFINNAPCADSVPPLLVYEAKIRIRSEKNQRELPLQEFLSRPYKTQLIPDELVTQIVLPLRFENYWGAFYKLGRRRGVAISRITLAVSMKIENLTIHDIHIASGAVTPIGIRFPELEDFARGKQIHDDLFKQLAQKLGKAILEKTGLRWSTAYKLPVVRQMFYQLLTNVTVTLAERM